MSKIFYTHNSLEKWAEKILILVLLNSWLGDKIYSPEFKLWVGFVLGCKTFL